MSHLGKHVRGGVAATELAVALPILMLLALSCADFGRVMHHYQIVSNAARTGAEAGAMHQFTTLSQSDWEADVRAAVVEELAGLPGFNESKLKYELKTTTDANDLATVDVKISYPFKSAVSWPGLPHQIDLKAISRVRQFR
ncbi:TadE family protein [Lacipirellula sp.]|uniref:TadE family protein n=1 Tax=Lacipirellula sp. TaxID=2691419 RepID=UPI003D095E50